MIGQVHRHHALPARPPPDWFSCGGIGRGTWRHELSALAGNSLDPSVLSVSQSSCSVRCIKDDCADRVASTQPHSVVAPPAQESPSPNPGMLGMNESSWMPPFWPERIVISEAGARSDAPVVLQEVNHQEDSRSDHFGIDISLFNISFQIYTELKQKKQRKVRFENVKETDLHFPSSSCLDTRSLRTFKKNVAGACLRDGVPLGRTIMQNDKDNKLVWHYYVNGDAAFGSSKNVEVKSDAHFLHFLEACSQSRRTMGVRISMESPVLKAGERRKKSAVRASLKRSNKEYIASSEGAPSTDEDSDKGSESDCSVDDDDTQDLANACVMIRKGLTGGPLGSGETPYCTDPEVPGRRVRITPSLLKMWAEDIVHKVPGVSALVPPMARPEFKCKQIKRAGVHVLDRVEDQHSMEPPPKRAALGNGVGEVEPLSVEVTLAAFLHFANIRAAEKVENLLDVLDSLGIDHWSVFLREACLEPLEEAGVDFGTRQKLVIAAPAWEVKLSRSADGFCT